jgi:hypothetical protein
LEKRLNGFESIYFFHFDQLICTKKR